MQHCIGGLTGLAEHAIKTVSFIVADRHAGGSHKKVGHGESIDGPCGIHRKGGRLREACGDP